LRNPHGQSVAIAQHQLLGTGKTMGNQDIGNLVGVLGSHEDPGDIIHTQGANRQP
jgi:hypothetical protein